MADRQRANGLVLIADGDGDTRACITALMATSGFRVMEAKSGLEALETIRRLRPDVVVLEPALPDICGYEVCKQIRDEFGEAIRIVFISATRTEPMDFVAGMLIGADYCLSKPIVADQLLARVRRLLQASDSASSDHSASNGNNSCVSRGLTARELQVLSLLAEGLGQREIAAHLSISARTVGTHIEHILVKLGVRSRAQAVASAYRSGLPLDSPPGETEQGIRTLSEA